MGKEHKQPECEVKQLYMVMRHGVRFAGAGTMRSMNNLLPQIAQAVLNQSAKGDLCPRTLNALKNWQPWNNPDALHLKLAHPGAEQMFNLGQHVFTVYPELFDFDETLNETLEVRHAQSSDVRKSAMAFVDGLLFRAHDPTLVESVKKSALTTRAVKDRLIQPTQACKRYVIKRHFYPYDSDNFERFKYEHAAGYRSMLWRLGHRLGSDTSADSSAAFHMYEACRFGHALYGDDTWCQALGVDALSVYEYEQDMKIYHRYGYGNPVNYEGMCTMVKDIMQAVRARITGQSQKKVLIRVGHSRTVVPLLARLGFFKGDQILRAGDMALHSNRRWKLNKVNPFSANIAFVISECSGQHFLRIYLNEREIELPGCSSPCPVAEMFRIMDSVSRNCDYREICDVGPEFQKGMPF